MSGTQSSEETRAGMAHIEDLLGCAESFLREGNEEWGAMALTTAQRATKEVTGKEVPADICAIRALLG